MTGRVESDPLIPQEVFSNAVSDEVRRDADSETIRLRAKNAENSDATHVTPWRRSAKSGRSCKPVNVMRRAKHRLVKREQLEKLFVHQHQSVRASPPSRRPVFDSCGA